MKFNVHWSLVLNLFVIYHTLASLVVLAYLEILFIAQREKYPYSEFFWSVFSTFGLNSEKYSLSLHIQSECGKIRTWETPNADTFYAVLVAAIMLTNILRNAIKISWNLVKILKFQDVERTATPVSFNCLKKMIQPYHDTLVNVVQVPLFDCFLTSWGEQTQLTRLFLCTEILKKFFEKSAYSSTRIKSFWFDEMPWKPKIRCINYEKNNFLRYQPISMLKKCRKIHC